MNMTKSLGLFLSLFSTNESTPKSTDTVVAPIPIPCSPLTMEAVVRPAHEYVEWEDKFVKNDNQFFATLLGRGNKKKQVCSVRIFKTDDLKASEVVSLPDGWEPFAVRTFHGGGSQGFARKCIYGG